MALGTLWLIFKQDKILKKMKAEDNLQANNYQRSSIDSLSQQSEKSYDGRKDKHILLDELAFLPPINKLKVDYRLIALDQAGKLPNQTCQELLQNADKIEKWLLERNVSEGRLAHGIHS
jgi:hypothetical protein